MPGGTGSSRYSVRMPSGARHPAGVRGDGSPRSKRQASIEELKALTHPARWRILRLCLDQSLTNQEVADRLGMSPATTLRHVRALAEAGFLVAEPVRSGQRGSRERPYRATGRTWGLVAVDLDAPELVQRVDLAILAAHRAELLEAGPDSGRDLSRGVLRLGPDSRKELTDRMQVLLSEFRDRNEDDGEPLSYLWSLVARPKDLRAAERRAANAVSLATSVIATATGRICGTSTAGVNATTPNAISTPPEASPSAVATRGVRSVRRTMSRASRGSRSTTAVNPATVAAASAPSPMTNGVRLTWVSAGIQIRIRASSVNA